MRTHEIIEQLRQKRGCTWRWLSDQTGIEYKRLLRIAKHGRGVLSFVDAVLIAEALGADVSVLARGNRDTVHEVAA